MKDGLPSRTSSPLKNDTIHFYVKDATESRFFPLRRPLSEASLKIYKEDDGDGRLYRFGNKKVNGVAQVDRSKKIYLDEHKGVKMSDWWTDIPTIRGTNKERCGYPTQKPLKLLERIINATTEPGDLVLDPFCGCATTCIAAERLNRKWIGIDISSHAADLVIKRLQKQEVPLGPGGTQVNCNKTQTELDSELYAITPRTNN